MRARAMAKAVLFAFLCGSLFYGYGAWTFDRKVKIFNTKIQLGDNPADVRALLGAPSHVIVEHQEKKTKRDNQLMRPDHTATWIYSGMLFFRDDLCLVFDGQTQRLIEKKRMTLIIE